MLPIAPLSLSFFFFAPCLLSLRVLLTDSKGAAKLHGYLGAGDGQEEILAWRGLRLDRLQTSPWPFSRPETQPPPPAGETTRNRIQQCRCSENHFPFDEEI